MAKEIDYTNYKDSLPPQKLSIYKKGEKWRQACVDAIISRQDSTGDGFRKSNMKILYDLYNSNFNLDDLKYVTNPFNVEDGFPANPQAFNIIKPKIDLLLGEMSKRPRHMNIVQSNPGVQSELLEVKKQLLMQFLMQEAGITNPEEADPLTLEKIEKYIKRDYKTIAEKSAVVSKEYIRYKQNVDHEFLKVYKDELIAGEGFCYTGVINNDPYVERVNPMHCDYDRDSDTEFVEDRAWFLRVERMTPVAIYDRFYDIMEEKDLNKVLELAESRGRSSVAGSGDVNSTSIVYKEKVSHKFLETDEDENSYTVSVYHATWKSYKKVGFLVYIDENGEEQTEYVDETYKVSEGEEIEWDWIVEVWEGYRIHEDIYIGIKPIDYQHVSIDNPNSAKLPYCGVIHNNTNSKAKSLVAIMKPLQYMYITLWYRLELAIARDKGKVLTMDITQIPKGLDVDINKWLHYLTAIGVNFVNPYDEGWNIPGREGGKPSQYNQISAQDLGMTQVIAEYIQLLDKIEHMIGEISGISEAREGQIHQSSLVGNVQREVVQSSHITEPLFWLHSQFEKNVYTNVINVAKSVWDNTKKIHYIANDGTRVFMQITDDFLYSDFDIFVTDSTKDANDIELLKQLLQPAMQNGASLLDVTEILTAQNLSDIKTKLAEIEENKMKMIQEQQQAEQQMAQMEQQIKAEELRIKEEDSIRKSETDIEVALIKAETDMNKAMLDGDVDNTDDGSEEEKIELQREKMRQDAELKRKQIQESVRSAKANEAIQREKLKIDRIKANKPTSKSN